MSNLENVIKAIESAKKENISFYDNPKNPKEKIVIDETNVAQIVTISNNVVTSCTCSDTVCKHMCRVSMKLKIDIAFEKKKVVKRTTKSKKTEKVIKLKDKA